MKKIEAVSHFGSQQAIANALGIHKSSISQWGEDVPPLRAYQLKEIIEAQSVSANDDEGDVAA